MDLEVADLEDVAPAPGPPFGPSGPPRTIPVPTVAGALDDDDVTAGKHVVELCVMVLDRLEHAPRLGEALLDLIDALGQSPFREVDEGVVVEQLQEVASAVQAHEVLEDDGLPLLVDHRPGADTHALSLPVLVAVFLFQLLCPAWPGPRCSRRPQRRAGFQSRVARARRGASSRRALSGVTTSSGANFS